LTLINGDGSPPRGRIDIVVENNIITEIQVVGYPGVEIKDDDRPKLKSGGKELDANGIYLLPGFIDMHGHIDGVAQSANRDYVFKLWMAHSITTVREPSGRNIDWTLYLKKRSEANEIVAPRIFADTGFGQTTKEFNPLSDAPISTSEATREWVRAHAKHVADGIKFFGAEPEIMAAALDENKKSGLGSAYHHAQLTWHVGMSATLLEQA
jgi:imidazolonepropionase-like amidohydrolase